MQQQCYGAGAVGLLGARSLEPHLGGADVQGQHRLSIPHVCLHFAFHDWNVAANEMVSIVAIVLAFIVFLLLATFPGWHTEDREGSDVDIKRFPSRAVSQAALTLIFIAAVFVLVSVLWQHTASIAAAQIAQDLGNGSIRSSVGTTAMILGWFGFGLLVVVTIGLLVMILSINLVEQVSEEEI